MHPLLDLTARRVVAHRGNRAYAPENTLEAFDQAVALGVDALELDVHLTADGVPVIHHDRTLDRTTDGRGPLAARTLAELRALDAGARWTRDGGRSFPYRGRGIGIPTLAELLDRHPAVPLVLEIKAREAAPAVLATLRRHGAEGRVIVDSFDGGALLPFRGTTVAVGPSRNGVARLLACAAVGWQPRSVPYRAIFVPPSHGALRLPLGRFARTLRPLGVPVHVWTVNDPAEARALWQQGITGIITDDPGTMLRERGALAAAG